MVIGEAGVGKSRLALEFAEMLRPDARVVTGRCPVYGDGITFWPLREIVMEVTGGSARDGLVGLLAGEDDAGSTADQVAGVIGLTGAPGRPDELLPAVRCLFEALAGEQPLVVVFEDVHWAQPTFLDLVAYLAAFTRKAVLLLCLARPEFLEERRA
jgi:predicted ATPase